jgi:hypothetical protein
MAGESIEETLSSAIIFIVSDRIPTLKLNSAVLSSLPRYQPVTAFGFLYRGIEANKAAILNLH